MAADETRMPRLEAAPVEERADDGPVNLAAARAPALPPAAGGYAEGAPLDLDPDRVDAAVLAVLLLTAHRPDKLDAWRSWKGVDWEAADRLYEKGYIADPKSKAKSVALTRAGFERGRALLQALCGRDD
jgi:hypothetical protein